VVWGCHGIGTFDWTVGKFLDSFGVVFLFSVDAWGSDEPEGA
jgi:hypothetical protein